MNDTPGQSPKSRQPVRLEPAKTEAPASSSARKAVRGKRTAANKLDKPVGAISSVVESAFSTGRAQRPAAQFKRLDWAHVRDRARQYALLARVDKPVGAALLLWPTWWALWLAAGDFPPWGSLVVFTLGVFLMRSAGCVINDYADRWLDSSVQRTKGRPLADGKVAPREALLVFFVLIVLAFSLVLFTNAITIKLSLVGAFLAVTYPYMKRHTYLPQVYLGAAFGWAIPMAFAAVGGKLPALAWLLFLANVLWTTIYDTEYAMVDRDDDIRVGAKSTAILFGDADRAIIGVLMATFLFSMLLVGSRAGLHWPFFVSVGVAGLLFGHQQWLIRARDRDGCFRAFRNNNAVGLVLFAGIALAYALR